MVGSFRYAVGTSYSSMDNIKVTSDVVWCLASWKKTHLILIIKVWKASFYTVYQYGGEDLKVNVK